MKKALIFSAALLTMLWIGLAHTNHQEINKENQKEVQANFGERQISTAQFLPEFRLFYEGTDRLFANKTFPNPIQALVVPHHSLVAAYTAEAIAQLAKSKELPTAVIIMGPNHENQGPSCATTTLSWQTPFGQVNCQLEIIEELLSQRLIEEADDLFFNEHSIGAIQPWLARYLPDVPVVPLIFHYNNTQQKVSAILTALKPWLDQGAVLIASIDFSHGLDQAGAEKKDQQMTDYLQNNDYKKIAHLDSSFLDGPGILGAMIKYYSESTNSKIQILANTNGGAILSYPSGKEVTSYFVLAF